MDKDIRDYLKYYIGQEAKMPGYTVIISHSLLADEHAMKHWAIRPILRKLESMTEEECLELQRLSPFFIEGTDEKYIKNRLHVIKEGMIAFRNLLPERFHYLLSRGFDLWNLIDAGLAIDKENQHS